MEKDVLKRIGKIRLLALDVDGTLTDGGLLIGPDGEVAKTFHVHDGLGMAAALKAGLGIALITGRHSACVAFRANELGISDVYQGVKNKVAVLEQLAQKHALARDEIAYAGDDLNDLAAMEWSGLACSVANAAAEVRQAAHWVTDLPGGRGAVRELIVGILTAQGRWENIVAEYKTARIAVQQ